MMAKKKNLFDIFVYYLVRIIMSPLYLMSYRMIHALGRFYGTLGYYLARRYRKAALNNLALVKELNLSEKEMKRTAKGAFINLVTNSLEYFRLPRSRNKMQKFVQARNLEPSLDLINNHKGLVGVTGHFGNWELCFIHFTAFAFQGICVARPIQNKKLYHFIKTVRQMHGGQVIEKEKALTHGLKALNKGAAFSMVNDQAFIESTYSYPFLGVNAWTSNAPALMAYKANSPLVTFKIKRKKGGQYELIASDPIWPDKTKPWKEEVKRLMDCMMSDFENHVKKYPEQWLWQHRRWKQGGFNRVYEKYQADSILFIIPEGRKEFDLINEGTPVLSKIYKRSFLTFLVPQKYKKEFLNNNHEILYYNSYKDLFIRDYRFQIVFDFYKDTRVKKHFFKLAASKYYTFENLRDFVIKKYPKKTKALSGIDLFKKSLCLAKTDFK